MVILNVLTVNIETRELYMYYIVHHGKVPMNTLEDINYVKKLYGLNVLKEAGLLIIDLVGVYLEDNTPIWDEKDVTWTQAS